MSGDEKALIIFCMAIIYLLDVAVLQKVHFLLDALFRDLAVLVVVSEYILELLWTFDVWQECLMLVFALL